MRVLFFNEGNLGSHVLGQGQLDVALRTGLDASTGVDARFAGLEPLGRWTGAVASLPLPSPAGLDHGLRTLRWHAVQSLRARAQIRREVGAWPAGVIHVHSQSVALAMGAQLGAVPVVLSLDATVSDWAAMPAWSAHPGRPAAGIAPSRALERRALLRAPLVLAWTAWARGAAERDAPGANVIEHHPGLDLERHHPAPRSERELPRLLFVGGRFAEKGGQDLLEALGADLGRTVELDLVTPAPVPPRAGVRVHTLLPGDQRLLELQQQADLVCLPTHGDASPWALLEAMACGTPVVASPVGAIGELLDDGRAGLLVPHGEPRLLGAALRALIGDPQRRAELGARARARCEQRYDARRQFTTLIEHLRQVQAMPRRRSSTRRSSPPSARNPNSSAG